MDNRGSITLLGLWISAAAAAIALAALSTERLRADTAARALWAAHARFAAVDATLVAQAGNFSQVSFERSVDGYVVHAERLFTDDQRTALLMCDVNGGKLHGIFRVRWTRVGADWIPLSWSER